MNKYVRSFKRFFFLPFVLFVQSLWRYGSKRYQELFRLFLHQFMILHSYTFWMDDNFLIQVHYLEKNMKKKQISKIIVT